ncbi:MAG: hypothetical protein FJ280_27240 [Planctomycetes bacterium]|nr:hypothetical protein [Planctomycetota bacterium]
MSNLRKIRRAGRRGHFQATSPVAAGPTEPLELDAGELEAILTRAKTAPMSEAEYIKLHAVVETLLFLTTELEKKHVSIQKLKQLLFGATAESTRKVVQNILDEAGSESPAGKGENQRQDAEPPEKAKGHGLRECRSGPAGPPPGPSTRGGHRVRVAEIAVPSVR